jgi:hypothetical protein
MFENLKLRQIKRYIKSQLLTSKAYTPEYFYNLKGERVSLFDFSNDASIKTAVLNVPELAATLNYLSTAFSSGIFKEVRNGEEQENSQIIELLNNPHPLYSGTYLKRIILEQLFAYGRAYVYMDRSFSRRENTSNISILETPNIKTFVGDVSINDYLSGADDIIKRYEYTYNGKQESINDVENVITFTWNTEVSINNQYLRYISPLKPLEEALQVTPAMFNIMSNLMNNYGVRGYISNQTKDVSGSIPLTPEDKKIIEEEFKKLGLKKGQRQFSYISYPMQFVPISSPIKDMLLPEQQKMVKNIIADVLNFDTTLLNKDSSAKLNETSGSAYSESRKSMFSENLIPVGNNITQSLTDYFYKFKSNSNIILDFSHLDVFTEDERDMAEKIGEVSNFVIELNQAVSDPLNNMTRDNAISVLTLNGYSLEEAKSLIS